MYYDRLEHVFVRGKISNVKRRRFLVWFRPKIHKLCVLKTYKDMDELLVIAIEVEKVFWKIGEIAFELLKDEREAEIIKGKISTNHIFMF
jgi:hypothetical protein